MSFGSTGPKGRMKIERRIKASFSVIGKEGSTADGDGFIPKLWEDANAHFHEIEHLAKRDEKGELCGIWGAMSDLSHSFRPWEDHFSQGLYLAGIECRADARAPEGWTKWVVPGYEYLCAACESTDTFHRVMEYLDGSGIALVGAVHDFTDPKTGENALFFPIRRL